MQKAGGIPAFSYHQIPTGLSRLRAGFPSAPRCEQNYCQTNREETIGGRFRSHHDVLLRSIQRIRCVDIDIGELRGVHSHHG